jgi:hypothetical protein
MRWLDNKISIVMGLHSQRTVFLNWYINMMLLWLSIAFFGIIEHTSWSEFRQLWVGRQLNLQRPINACIGACLCCYQHDALGLCAHWAANRSFVSLCWDFVCVFLVTLYWVPPVLSVTIIHSACFTDLLLGLVALLQDFRNTLLTAGNTQWSWCTTAAGIL